MYLVASNWVSIWEICICVQILYHKVVENQDPESRTVGVIMECPLKQDMKIERPRCSTALLSIYKSLIHPFYPSSDLL